MIITSAKLWWRYNVCLGKGVAAVSGLILGHKIVDYVVLSILITYFTNKEEENLVKAAIFVNILEGIAAILVIVIKYVGNVHICSFRVVVLTTILYATGLVLLCLQASTLIARFKSNQLYIIIIFLLAIGKAGGNAILPSLLTNQLVTCESNGNEDYNRVEAREKFWMRSLENFAIILMLTVFAHLGWIKTFVYSTSLFVASGILFLCGFSFNSCSELPGSALTTFFSVLKVAILKRHLDYPSSPNQFFKNDGCQVHLLPRLRFQLLRWVDKVATIESSPASPEEQEKAGILCRAKQIRDIKLLLKMVPIWGVFLGFFLVQSTANTFFYEQGNNMKHSGYILVLVVLHILSKSTISFMYNLMLSKWIPEEKQRGAKIVRIWLGIVSSILCLSVASRVEVHRLKFLNDYDTTPMSIFWLVPQIILLGFMEGLAVNGLDDLVMDRISKSMVEYGNGFNEIVEGIGRFLSIYSIHLFKNYFGYTINESHLDEYYQILAVVGFVTMCLFWYVTNDNEDE